MSIGRTRAETPLHTFAGRGAGPEAQCLAQQVAGASGGGGWHALQAVLRYNGLWFALQQ